MSLPEIGKSITDHLLLRGRGTWKDAPVCPSCGEPTFPRGRCLNTGRCWWCEFPRAGGLAGGGNE